MSTSNNEKIEYNLVQLKLLLVKEKKYSIISLNNLSLKLISLPTGRNDILLFKFRNDILLSKIKFPFKIIHHHNSTRI